MDNDKLPQGSSAPRAPGSTTPGGGNGPGSSTPAAEPFTSGMTTGATLLTIFAPFIALIVALMMHGSERDPARRSFLRSWATVAGVVTGVEVIIGIVLVTAILASGPKVDHSGPCVGGPQIGAAGTPLGGGRFRFPCVSGGSAVVRFQDATGPTP